MRTRVGLVYDPVYLKHNTGVHVENAQRLEATMALIEETGLKNKLFPLNPRPATEAELSAVHSNEYITSVRAKSKTDQTIRLDPDTVISSGSWEAALNAAGGAIVAVESVVHRIVDYSFALVRPPGHHATCWHAMGFCIFNNVAIAAKYALSNLHINRILIVDFDVHHGNGTQDAFYDDPHVLYFSIHQYPFYPGTGSVNEIGIKSGEGFTVNIPLLPGCGDEEYQAIFEDILAPISRRYKPELILVSAGYDAHWADRLAQMNLSITGFARITEILKVLADLFCQKHLVFCLEGGYDLQAMPLSVIATLNVLLGKKEINDPLGVKESDRKPSNFSTYLKMVKDIHHLK